MLANAVLEEPSLTAVSEDSLKQLKVCCFAGYIAILNANYVLTSW